MGDEVSATPVVQLGQNYLAPKRPLSAKLSFVTQIFVLILAIFFYRNGPFLLFENNFTLFFIEKKKIFRFKLIK